MATDIEESDMDDHEKPAPPKRQCTRLLKSNDTIWDMDKHSNGKEDIAQETENVEFDDAERLSREKLRRWQACQLTKGYVDNSVNRVLETYIRSSTPYFLGESRFHLLRGNDMEDTAVMMAIRNHGLVRSADRISRSSAFYIDKAAEYFNKKKKADVHCSCPSDFVEGDSNFENSAATTSADSLTLNEVEDTEEYNKLDLDLDKIDENDQQENFLERAVAEAIKKKGLSALSVDYG